MKMVLSQNASAIRPLNLYPWVYISLVFGASLALPDKACTFKVALQNFQTIFSWELKNHSIVPTHYTLWYTIMSKYEDMKIVEDCTNITRLFCDLTGLWDNMPETYIPRVVGFKGNTVLVSCIDSVFLPMNMTLEPPDFEIVGSADHINVIVKFPSRAPKTIDVERLQHHFYLIIEQRSEEMVKKHKPRINGNITGDFIYVMDKLIPNTNYCVSIYFEPKNLGTITKSPLKCALLPGQEPESSESAKIGGIITAFLIATVFISSVVTLKRTGYLCLRLDLPSALNFSNRPTRIFLELPPLEAVDTVEVIYVSRKKKVWDYNYDESDSEEEATPTTSAGGYTRHGLILQPLTQASTSSPDSEESQFTDPDVDEPDLPEDEAEPLLVPGPRAEQSEPASGPCERRASPLQDPFSKKDSSATEGSEDRIIFNVNLNSVFVQALDDDGDVSPMLPEETVDLEDPSEMESSFLIAREDGMPPPFPSPSEECLGSEDASSEESDTSESDADIRDGYIMR
ncbi:interferon alpha/beta receptor 2 [Trichechus manatus latirostris]|uniref:Interferon alpha/beta receptor 2 n=1 Tax=Trichechus manatus latirostris TaxID=127582 RepID=A0A2Y9RTY2_TRIMA|nr:interferon alpha/beta receptor 2 [Trichechus manatus latirostris]XP_023597075.1 interferon alpha/beta receptor 2 [Trichechus manatus latirostris]XP_023597076.1 interferon alpha/beta receptor 2 [Trichechus manatus latirostris]XP_023597077.1 interferon alpha/beta receptor 2 [Trichechus manatus latirostris]